MIYTLEINYVDGNKYIKHKKNVDVQVFYNKKGKVYKIVFGDETFIIDDEKVIGFELKRTA
jgi:hypothetical protein